ncbi:MAG: Na+/H+ antiporter NhaC family protein [Acidobacteria bacterium]|nr:Na+/H+ antiporter NhaC family protein [Acidobacteriota bacterium]
MATPFLIAAFSLPLALWALPANAVVQDPVVVDLQLETPLVVIANVPFSVTVTPIGANPGELLHLEARVVQDGDVIGSVVEATAQGDAPVVLKELITPEAGTATLEVTAGTLHRSVEIHALNGFLTVLPPLLAILLAVVFRQVIVALLAGVWLGAFLVNGFAPLTAILRVLDQYLLTALTDSGHASIIIFSMLLGGMVALMSRSGGTRGIVDSIRGWASGRRSTQTVTWLMGMFIFFDDYANTLIVGNTMRPLTDRVRISREKLAYLVDSTAAPIASVALISTWVGVEVSLIGDALKAIGSDIDPYHMFLSSIPYCFYPLLALMFGLAVAITGKDFGPMLAAEKRAASGRLLAENATPLADYDSSQVEPRDNIPCRWYNAVLPIATVLSVTLVGLWLTGRASLAAEGNALGTLPLTRVFIGGGVFESVGSIFSAADSYKTLIWGSGLGCLVAAMLALSQGLMSMVETLETWMAGLKSMLLAIIILLLAWSIGAVCGDLHTADYLVNMVSGAIWWPLLPALVFIISGGVAFATGTSWGAMAILIPLVVPLASEMAGLHGLDAGSASTLLLGAVSSVLAGAVWGDHCSPISDTTIMSSMASGSDHIDHVRTQMPYALLVGAVGILLGNLPSAFGLSPWLCLLMGSAVLLGILWLAGHRTTTGSLVDTPEAVD